MFFFSLCNSSRRFSLSLSLLQPQNLLFQVMEITFEKEFNGTPQQKDRTQFYEKMKKVVVLAQGELDNITVGGITLPQPGFILTCSDVVLPKKTVVRRADKAEKWEAKLLHRDGENNLTLLQIKDLTSWGEWDYAKICDDDKRIQIGMEVLSISHPSSLDFTLSVGQVAFQCKSPLTCEDRPNPFGKTPNCRLVKDLFGQEEPTNLSPTLTLIQINNFHGSVGLSGGPVFDSCGIVIGMCIFTRNNFDFAVHSRVLQKFCEKNLTRAGTSGRKMKKKTKKYRSTS